MNSNCFFAYKEALIKVALSLLFGGVVLRFLPNCEIYSIDKYTDVSCSLRLLTCPLFPMSQMLSH